MSIFEQQRTTKPTAAAAAGFVRPVIPAQPIARDAVGTGGTAAPAPSPRIAADPGRTGRHRYRPLHVERHVLLAADTAAVATAAQVLGSWHALLVGIPAMAVWGTRGLYARRITLSLLDDLPALLAGVTIGMAPVLLLPLTAPRVTGPDALVLFVLLAGLFVLGRAVAIPYLLRQRRTGRLRYPTLMLGHGALATSLMERIDEHPETGLRVAGTVASGHGSTNGRYPVLGAPDDLCQIIERFGITDVVVGYGGLPSSTMIEILRTCDRLEVEIYLLPRLFEMHALRTGDDRIWDLPLIRVRRPAHRHISWRMKRAFDITVAGAMLFALAPVLLLAAIAVRLELGRGILFRQLRVGLDGLPFEVLKFRSMSSLPPNVSSPWTVADSNRVGPVGRFIRRYSVDELPQLFNVLRGDMSMVGPRPERPEYVAEFSAAIPRYAHRHRVPVGLTGLAAVNGLRGDTSIEQRARFDNWYIENWSLWLDLKIIARTITAVVRATGS